MEKWLEDMQTTLVLIRTLATGNKIGGSEDSFRSLQDFIHMEHRFDIGFFQKHSERRCGSLFSIVQGTYIIILRYVLSQKLMVDCVAGKTEQNYW